MDLSNIKKKLFSKIHSSKVTAVPASKAEIHLRPPVVSGSESSLPEASTPENQPASLDFSKAEILLSIFPVIKNLIGRCEEHSIEQADRNRTSYRGSAKYRYFGYVSAALVSLEEHLVSTQESGKADEFDDTITQLAQCLESMLGNSDIDISHGLLPHLWELARAPSKHNTSLLDFAQGNLDSRGIQDWKAFSKSLDALTDQLQRVGYDSEGENPDQERSIIPRRPLPGVGEFIRHTFSAMVCTCNLHSVRELSLRLCTYKGSNTTITPGTVTVLAKEACGPLRTWTEIQVHGCHEVSFERGARNNKFVRNSSSQDKPSPTRSPSFQLDPTACICACYRPAFRPEFWRLNIHLHESKISRWWADKRASSSWDLRHQINLEQLKSPTLNGMARMTLSVFLAYSMFYLYGGSWARGRWRRENIVFFADGNDIPMRPFLKVPPPTSVSNKDQSRDELMSFHRYPDFLDLGIMLLEIYFGQSLETMLGQDQGLVSVDEYYAAACEIYDKGRLNIYSRGLRCAVENCLKPDFNVDFGTEDPDDDELRSRIFDTVVRPLEEDLYHSFHDDISIDSLDDDASTKIRLRFETLGSDQDEHRTRQNSPMNKRKLSISGSLPPLKERSWMGRSCSPANVAQNFELFSNESKTKADSAKHTATDDWMKRFTGLVDQYHVDNGGHLTKTEKQTSNRLRVAILDTGIDMNHPDFFGDERVRECKSWTDTSAHEDASGHGTHIASTILSLTKNVDIYIAKITDSNVIELKNTGRISEAIDHACQVWKVDIVSLSFGFHRGIQSIQRAIDQAVSPDRNMIILAAASNDASNTPLAYPASHDMVLCINSADGLGNRSAFNPTAKEDADNFCVVGEDIDGAWPCAQTQYPGVRRMSGTSFATPVGVAVAAFMLEFVEKNAPEHAEWLVPLKSYRGVRAVFRALSQRRDGAYRLVNPLYDFSRNESARTQVLIRIENELNN